MKNILCRVFGHKPYRQQLLLISKTKSGKWCNAFEFRCSRCGDILYTDEKEDTHDTEE